jgi:hypothetical protein
VRANQNLGSLSKSFESSEKFVQLTKNSEDKLRFPLIIIIIIIIITHELLGLKKMN